MILIEIGELVVQQDGWWEVCRDVYSHETCSLSADVRIGGVIEECPLRLRPVRVALAEAVRECRHVDE